MKKYGMLIFTLFILSVTVLIYFYENINLPNLNYNHPQISIKSKKYGHIHNVIWSNFDEDYILILASNRDEEVNQNISTLYAINIDTGNTTEIYEFKTHKNLEDYIQKTDLLSHWLYVASPEGVYRLTLDNDYSARLEEFYRIKDFADVIGLNITNKILYTKDNGKLLYVKGLSSFSFNFFDRNFNKDAVRVYSVKPENNMLGAINDSIFYSRLERNGLNLYHLNIENNIQFKNRLIAKNILSLKNTLGNDSIKGLMTVENGYGIYNLKWLKRKGKGFYEANLINSIPKNTDILGQIPSIDGWNYRTIYTSFEENHMGSIIKQEYDEVTKIIKNKPIVGPVSISCDGNKILFFTYEDNEYHINICDKDGKNLRDISKFIE
ncbi:hypothetical protein R9X47_17220 [Wukongibacter baidiensis]|uniref:hypothetical protein n=1 Tax=Wukongibacter baidiensis TaxID=1723361 RepID=UPI003D7F1F8F